MHHVLGDIPQSEYRLLAAVSMREEAKEGRRRGGRRWKEREGRSNCIHKKNVLSLGR